MSRDDVQKYLDAGIAFTNLTRSRAEDLVAQLVDSGVFQSGDARAKVDELIDRSRKGSEQLVSQIRTEVSNQLSAMGITSLEDLAREVATVIGRSADAGKAATTKTVAKKTVAKTPAPKSSATKKPAAKKSVPKTSSPNKAAARKPAARKSPAKQTAGEQTVPTTSTAEPAPVATEAAADSRAPEPGASD